MIYTALDYLLGFIQLAIFARVLLTWVPIQKENQLIRFIHHLTEPVLAPVRALIDRVSAKSNSMFDFSPLIALLLLQAIRYFIPR